MRPGVRISTGIGVLLVAIGIAAGQIGGLQGARPEGATTGRPAPDLVGIADWVGSPPLTLQSLRGDVVLIDFWTYSCVNCVRTFPHLRALDQRYRAAGLHVIGIHSPEFEFEKSRSRVEGAARKHRLTYPIALDNEMATWRAFRNNSWPHVYLIDARGRIRFDHIGEGGEAEIEAAVRELLADAGKDLPPPLDQHEASRAAGSITPEVYAGFRRGSLGNGEGYRPQRVADYRPPTRQQIDDVGPTGSFFLAGSWRAEGEYVEAATDASLIIRFRAKEVFIVAAPGAGGSAVSVMIDGRSRDVPAYGGQPPGAILRVRSSDLFKVFDAPTVETHTMRLTVSPGLRLYTFTFG